MSAQNVRAGRAWVSIEGDDSKLKKVLAATQQRLRKIGSTLTGIGTSMLKAGGAITAPLLGAAKLFSSVGSELADMSARTGVGVEALSALGHAARMTGADLGTVEMALRRSQGVVADAAGGSKEAAKALKALGLSADELKGLSPDKQFEKIAKRLAAIPDQANRSAAAMDLFGRSGTALLPMIADLDSLTDEARRFGLVMSAEDAEAADKFGDALDLLGSQLRMIVAAGGAAVAKFLQPYALKAADALAKVIEWTKKNGQLIVTIFKVGAAIAAGGVALVALGAAFSAAATVVGGVITGIAAVGAVLGAILSPIGLVVTALAGLAAYFFTATEAGGQALDWLAARFLQLKDEATTAFGGIADALSGGDFRLAGQILWAFLKLEFQKGVGVLEQIWLGFKQTFVTIAYGAFYGVQSFWEDLQHSLSVAWIETASLLGQTWTKFSSLVKSVWESTQSWLTDRLHELHGEFDDAFDVDAAKALNRQQTNDTQGDIENEKNARLAENDLNRIASRQGAEKQHAANQAGIGQAFTDATAAAAAGTAQRVAESEAEIARLMNELASLRQQAASKAGAAAPDMVPRMKGGGEEPDVGAMVEDSKKKLHVEGTFSGWGAGRFGGGASGGPAEKTAQNTQKAADLLRELVQRAKRGGGVAWK